jgi:hypothetical protein
MSGDLTDDQKAFKIVYEKLVDEIKGDENEWKVMLEHDYYYENVGTETNESAKNIVIMMHGKKHFNITTRAHVERVKLYINPVYDGRLK